MRNIMLRQKKNSNWVYYLIGALLLAAIVFVAVHEVPAPVEHVEEEISLGTK